MLHGVRVLDLTRILAGPFGTMLLADMGAEVIKIERPDGGDDTRATGPHFLAGESTYFLSVNRRKKSVVIDLARPEGREVLHALARNADVLVENFRPGVAERLGCDAKTLHAIEPRLIVCGMTAFGRTGPDRDHPAFDLTLQARGGTMGLTGEPRAIPVRMGPPMGDLAGGMYAAMAISAALYERTHTGLGRFIDLSLLDCQVSLLTYAAAFQLNHGVTLGPQGSAHAHATPYQAFATADAPITVAVFTDRFWPPFCRALGFAEWADDPTLATHVQRRARGRALVDAIDERLRTNSASHWRDALEREGVPCAPVQSVAAVFDDPQVLARNMVLTMEHPTAGTVRVAGSPIQHEQQRDQAVPCAPPPGLGEHTNEVLARVAGMDGTRIEALRAQGVIA